MILSQATFKDWTKYFERMPTRRINDQGASDYLAEYRLGRPIPARLNILEKLREALNPNVSPVIMRIHAKGYN